MKKLIIENDVETIMDFDDNDLAQLEIDKTENDKINAIIAAEIKDRADKADAKSALLIKLGLTEDEAKLLLS